MHFKDHFSAHAGLYREARPHYPDALFDWLSGVPTLAGGWQADLQQLDEGRLSATRTQPPPAAMLRILLNP